MNPLYRQLVRNSLQKPDNKQFAKYMLTKLMFRIKHPLCLGTAEKNPGGKIMFTFIINGFKLLIGICTLFLGIVTSERPMQTVCTTSVAVFFQQVHVQNHLKHSLLS